MDIRGKRFLVIGSAGLIGTHTVDAPMKEDVYEIVIYDGFVRGLGAVAARTLVLRTLYNLRLT